MSAALLCPNCGLPQVVIDCFAGPGGWEEGLRILGRGDETIGVEWDEVACATARAAGHKRILGDVSKVPPPKGFCVRGYIGSPPCQGWSRAGKGKSVLDRERVHELVDRMARGEDAHDFTTWQDPRSSLAAEPVRWVRELNPQWIALEQVEAVLPLWEHMGEVFRGWGYNVWVGKLCAADYGVAQERRRAVLMASRLFAVGPPAPTHARIPQEEGLLSGGRRKWVSMAEALLWGADDLVGFPRKHDGQGEPLVLDGEEYRARDLRTADQPAQVVTEARSWDRYPMFSATNVRPNSAARRADEPAPTVALGHNTPRWVDEEVVRDVREAVAARVSPRVNNQSGTLFDFAWPLDRPAPTVAGRGLVPMPGANANRFNGSTKSRNDGIRVTYDEGATIQSFAVGYPWAGGHTAIWRQIGDAVPPLLAAHILSALREGKVPEELREHGWRATTCREWG